MLLRFLKGTPFLLLPLVVLLTARPVGAQTPKITATRADKPPVLDGRDDDPVWQTITPISDFREGRPTENADPKRRTEFRVAYDPENLYVFVRAFDAPDSITSQLSRRDVLPPVDYLSVLVDPYRDGRTGHEFTVTPHGVKIDYAIFNDGNEDDAWDGIWDVAVQRDSEGWTAEFRIPFSQLKFPRTESVSFGFSIWRQIQRHTSVMSWPLYRQSKTGLASQFGILDGLNGLANPRRAELVPYVVTQNEPRLSSSGTFERHQKISVGGDLKYAVASNLTLNATINPDFGQVEADPGELNLGAFETFFSERRPFFVAGSSIFDFRINCFAVVDCGSGEQLFYSRRIGRNPALAGQYGDASTPTSTRVLGAAKLTGRTAGGLSVGLLDAVTDNVIGTLGRTAEPTANYTVLRANQDYAHGAGSIGLMATALNRSVDQWTENAMHRSAYTGGLDARRRVGRYEFSGSLMGSTVAGTATAIASTQRSPTHNFQRPDDDVAYDPTLTSLSGYSTELRFAKVSGERTGFETGYGRRSTGFETNDMGFLQRADQQTWTNWFAFRFNKPNKVFQRLNWNLNWWQYWTLDGLPTSRSFNTNVHTQFNNRWWLHMGGTKGFGQVYCDRECTRGGPALKTEPGFYPWAGIEGDGRHAFVPSFWVNYSRDDGGRSTSLNLNPSLEMKVSSRFSGSLSANYNHNENDTQWYANITDGGGTHYTFAALDQKTLGITARVNYTFTPEMSFQFYANPFLTKGNYSRVRELDDPRAAGYDGRFKPYTDASVTDNPGGFNVTQFRSNAVFRWEYRPGSTLFLVWSQGREGFAPEMGRETFGKDFSGLFDRRADDRFLIKISYWLNK